MQIINQNIEAIKNLCVKYKVKELYAFGSVTDEKKFNEKSDVDLLVDFDKTKIPEQDFADYFFDLADGLEKIFQRRVDLMTMKSLKNKFFIQSVNINKQQIYHAA